VRLRLVGAFLPIADDVLAGRQTSTRQQVRPFKLLLDRVLPDA
jgi:hypothetical protein